MPKEQRADLHERFALWLERMAGDRMSEYEEILGYHLEQVCRYRTELGMTDARTAGLGQAAAERLITSAERARERADFAGSEALLGSALEISQGTTQSRAAFELAVTLIDDVDFQASAEAAERAMEAARASGDRALEVRSRLIRAEAMVQIEPTYLLATARTEAEAALSELETLGDDDGIVHATLTLARMAFFDGWCGRCIEIADPLLGRASTLRFSDRRLVALNLSAGSYFGPARVEEALHLHDVALDLVGHSLVTRTAVLYTRAALFAMKGDADAWMTETTRADRMMDDLPESTRNLFQSRGEAPRLLGRLDEAERMFRGTAEFWQARGETAFNSTITALHAMVLCDLERFDEADDEASRSRDITAEDDFASQAAWRLAKARVESDGNHDEAISLAGEAISVMQPTDYLAWQGEGDEVHGMVLAAAGRTDQARAAFERSIGRFRAQRGRSSSETGSRTVGRSFGKMTTRSSSAMLVLAARRADEPLPVDLQGPQGPGVPFPHLRPST